MKIVSDKFVEKNETLFVSGSKSLTVLEVIEEKGRDAPYMLHCA
jgi:hypothetical protein